MIKNKAGGDVNQYQHISAVQLNTTYERKFKVVMVSVSPPPLCVVIHGLELWSGQTKDFKIDICCFSAKHASLRRKNKDGLAQNQDKVTCLPADCCISTLALITQLSVQVQYKANIIIISSNVTCSCHDTAEKLLIWN